LYLKRPAAAQQNGSEERERKTEFE
jgi:hypothetical protein